MKQSILVFTSSFHCDVNDVMEDLARRGESVFRINTDRIPHDLSFNFSMEYGETLGIFSGHGYTVRTSDVKSCWYRNARLPREVTGISSEYLDFIKEETRAALSSVYACTDAYWVNPPIVASQVIGNNKAYQMKVATQCGLNAPSTLITNDSAEVLAFCEKHGGVIAVKQLSAKVLLPEDGSDEIFGIYTNMVTRDDVIRLKDGIKFSPILCQEYVPKHLELRITVVGEQIFSCAIYSQERRATLHDWRRREMGKLKHEKYLLPPEIERKIIRAMNQWGICFGAIDMILTPSGDYVFLEVNPHGQWGWVEHLTKMPISRAVADLLATPPQ